MTSTLDLLEGRGWVVRKPNPDDRRSLLVQITPAGSAAANQILAGIRKVEVATLSRLTLAEREQLLDLLAKIIERAADVATESPIALQGRRNRPKRLDLPHSSFTGVTAGPPANRTRGGGPASPMGHRSRRRTARRRSVRPVRGRGDHSGAPKQADEFTCACCFPAQHRRSIHCGVNGRDGVNHELVRSGSVTPPLHRDYRNGVVRLRAGPPG
jgi:hypothetical protein